MQCTPYIETSRTLEIIRVPRSSCGNRKRPATATGPARSRPDFWLRSHRFPGSAGLRSLRIWTFGATGNRGRNRSGPRSRAPRRVSSEQCVDGSTRTTIVRCPLMCTFYRSNGVACSSKPVSPIGLPLRDLELHLTTSLLLIIN